MIPGLNPGGVHAFFEFLALFVGVQYYRLLRRHQGQGDILAGGGFPLALGCLLGAGLGNKLVFWAEFPHLLPLYWNRPEVWLAGQSMVGGLLGGLVGVELAKKAVGVRHSTGDLFVFPILLGLIIGRVGCFLAGLADGTYGLPTSLPWGVDFGDGVPRHPTQLYEIFFALALWGVLAGFQRRLELPAGLLFKVMLTAYLAWRLWVDGLKPVPFDVGMGFSGIQAVCLIGLLFYGPLLLRQWAQWRKEAPSS